MSGAKTFDNGVKSNCKDVLSLDSALLKAAVEQGYDKVIVSAKNIGNYNFWFKVYKGESSNVSGTTNRLYGNQETTGAEGSVTKEFTLSQLKDETDNYYIHVTSDGSSTSGHYMVITSLKFTNAEIEKNALITANISNADYDWAASEEALCVWTSSGAKTFDNGVKANCKDVLSLDSALLKAAVEQGYDEVIVSAKNIGNYNFWFKVYKGESSNVSGTTNRLYGNQETTGAEGSVTKEFTLSQLKDETDNYYIHVTSDGSSTSGHCMVITSLKFSKTTA